VSGTLDPAAPAGIPVRTVGLGGRIKEHPEDFLVEEVPVGPPTDDGPYALVQVEKRAASTPEVLLWLSKAAKVSEETIGYAGLKDAQAVARQWLTVPRVDPERLAGLRLPRFRVLSAARHAWPLKIGHLAGNRFTIRVRGADLSRVEAARAALEDLSRRGMPNAYGTQRFGVKQDGHLVGRAVVDEDWATFLGLVLGAPSRLEHDPRVREARSAYDAGDLDRSFDLFPLRHRTEKKALAALRRTGKPREAFLAVGRRPRRIWVAAWQSWVFNRILARRIEAGTLDRLLEGDRAWLHASGAIYPVRDAAAEVARAERIEASPTGPLVGYDLGLADGEPGRIEREVLREEGIEPEAFRSEHARARGGRRPLRAPVREASLEVEPEGTVLLRFLLPPGAFATVLLGVLLGPVEAADVAEEA
jgi:tRNA pseudouridine13 synthase